MQRWLWSGCFCLVTFWVAGQELRVEPGVDERILYLNELEYFIDTTQLIQFDQIASSGFGPNFRTNTNYQNKDFKTNVSYWIRIPIHHERATKHLWLLEFYDQTIDHIGAYVPNESGGYEKLVLGDHYPFTQRTFNHKNFEVPLDMRQDTTLIYYFNVRSHEFADIRIAFRSESRFIHYALNEYFLYGTFYGMILIIALYNFLVYLAIREIKNIYYIMYILSVAFYAMSLDGIAFQYLWPDHPAWNDYAVGFWLYMVILWALVFTRRFLSTRAKSPRLDKALRAMIGLRTILFLVEAFFFPEFFTFRVIEVIPLSLIFFTGIKIWMRGYRPARFFVIAYGLLLLGFLLRSLVYFDVLSITTLSHYSLHFSFVIEMLFLTFALGDRIRILKNNRDRALKRIIQQNQMNMLLKDKVNLELEEKVRERTIELDAKNLELADSNRRLVVQSLEINQINSLLDLDNWKLKNKVKEVLEERLHESIMDYAAFRTIYPDTLSCHRFLETLKWGTGFTCQRCGNEKYFEGANKFARRCTRCGYNESITGSTIFHGIKFPIEKAFYIAYVAVTGKREKTLEQLAAVVDLRTNTVWSFKRKVLERIKELEGHGKKPTIMRWEDVVLAYKNEPKSSVRGRKPHFLTRALKRFRA
ncbi:MAG TPA: 7TM diverse intracellular signaling domain-containing protein [Cyclobacteriaceae bacterium]|nr:7TM diverse intracellular signaling domain-containing protein [Cyclobacteriaceae bacterium]